MRLTKKQRQNRLGIDRLKQPTPDELLNTCLDLLRTKFYTQPGDDKCFAQDRKKLLAWVVLWPATWLNTRGVTIHGDRYREIFVQVFIQAAAHVQSKVHYRPAYLRHVIQSHFAIHGEDYYDQAKATRNQVESTMLALGKPTLAAPDPVKELATAARLLKPTKRPAKTPAKAAFNLELNLL